MGFWQDYRRDLRPKLPKTQDLLWPIYLLSVAALSITLPVSTLLAVEGSNLWLLLYLSIPLWLTVAYWAYWSEFGKGKEAP